MNNKKVLILFLIAVVCLPMMSTDIFISSLPQIQSEFHSHTATVNYILSVYMIGYAFSMIISGVLSDKFGRKKTLIIGILLYVLSSLFISMSTSIQYIIIFRFFQALGGGCGTVVARLIVKDAFEVVEQVKIMSLLSTGMAIAPALAPIFGSYLALVFSWKACFLFSFIVGAAILYYSYFILKETLNKSTVKSFQEIQSIFKTYEMAFKSKKFVGYTAIITFGWCAYFTFITSSSYVIQNSYGFSPRQYSLCITLLAFGYILGTSYARKLIKYYSINKIILFGVITSIIGSFVLLLSNFIPNIIFILIGSFIMRAGVGLLMPTSQVGALSVFDKNVGTAMGALFFVEFAISAFVTSVPTFFPGHILFYMSLTIFISTLFLIPGIIYASSKENNESRTQLGVVNG